VRRGISTRVGSWSGAEIDALRSEACVEISAERTLLRSLLCARKESHACAPTRDISDRMRASGEHARGLGRYRNAQHKSCLVVETLQVRFELGVHLIRMLTRSLRRPETKIEFRKLQPWPLIEAGQFGERSLLGGFRRDEAIFEILELRQRIRHEAPRSQ
jgi:hypothetical protein